MLPTFQTLTTIYPPLWIPMDDGVSQPVKMELMRENIHIPIYYLLLNGHRIRPDCDITDDSAAARWFWDLYQFFCVARIRLDDEPKKLPPAHFPPRPR